MNWHRTPSVFSIVAVAVAVVVVVVATTASAQIPKPTDAPVPLMPDESQRKVELPPGFSLQLVASEPLVTEPSGVCWDEQGRMFVCELHGYNLEGQYDIEALNETGQLDRVVRRVQANARAKQAALAQTYGTVKRLIDHDGDGRVDAAEVWADRLPPCYGICPARGGLIVACAPDIIYLADRDGDGRAEIQETLFSGFEVGALERGVNCPQWGIDGWIYFGRGHGGGTIHGPHLPAAVKLPSTDFRIRADGSAIEPVTGSTHTFGWTFTAAGERFVISTRTPGIYVAPLPWSDLARNPDVRYADLTRDAASDTRVYPRSQPHPWRSRRASDPGFAKYYTDRYGPEETAASGYFTSACSPLVYQDNALPGLQGHLLACEPAQNLVHRAVIERDGMDVRLQRVEAERNREFLASEDTWFHPMALSHAPDGAVYLVDFYREIIEDYSAIPRYLQQQYGLVNGRDFGRIWRLVHQDMPSAPHADMSRLPVASCVQELESPYSWRRQTAQRLLVERQVVAAAPAVRRVIRADAAMTAVLAALYALDGLAALDVPDILSALDHPQAAVRVHALRLGERWFAHDAPLLAAAARQIDHPDLRVRLQLALSLGYAPDDAALPLLVRLARENPDTRWMKDAILSSLAGRGGEMAVALFATLDESVVELPALLESLASAIAARHDSDELSGALRAVAASSHTHSQMAFLQGLSQGLGPARRVDLTSEGQAALQSLFDHADPAIRKQAESLRIVLGQETSQQRATRVASAIQQLADPQCPLEQQLAAVDQLAAEDDTELVDRMMAMLPHSTPRVRQAILQAMFSRHERLPMLVAAIEQRQLAPSALTAVQRSTLLEHTDDNLRRRAARELDGDVKIDRPTFERFVAALDGPHDLQRGEVTFREKCGTCHAAHGVGGAVGPDLSAEFKRAPETIVGDVLVPSEKISAGYETYVIETVEGRSLSGVLASESAGSLDLRQADGKQVSVLRREIQSIAALPISLMPDDLAKTVLPNELANVIAWLRSPSTQRVLFDDDASFIQQLTDGTGKVQAEANDRYAGAISLRVEPPQRYAARIEGWSFPIRENPDVGEYRYLRFAWKTLDAHGVMIELADDRRWPAATEANFRYVAGRNSSDWQAVRVSPDAPTQWTVVTRDLWRDFGDCTLTGIAPTALGGAVLFDRIELLRTVSDWP